MDLRKGHAMTNTYRAAILRSSDSQGTTVLTGPEHATLTDAALLAEAQREIDRANIREQMGDSEVVIGDWTE